MQSFLDRIKGAARLDGAVYEEVEHDTEATPQALGVVALSALAAGIGVLMHTDIGTMVMSVIAAILGWALWAALIWLIGTKLLPEEQTEADWGQLARTTGFAQAPGLLRVLGVIPVIGGLIYLLASVWMLVTMVVAVRHALDYSSTWRAIGVVVIGWLVNVMLAALLLNLGSAGA